MYKEYWFVVWTGSFVNTEIEKHQLIYSYFNTILFGNELMHLQINIKSNY
jgi:hypothetical protein